MSGLEAFGVVIGGLPLVINSVQACKPNYQSAKPKDRDTAKTLQNLADTLKRLHFLLRKDLEIIISSGSLPKERVKEIMHQPHAIYFRDADVLSAVHKALGDGFHTYISTLKRCAEVVMDLAGRLAGVTASSVPTRRKSSLKKKDLDRILEEMDHATVLLARIRVASTAASESERLPTPASAAAPPAVRAPTPPVAQAPPMGSPLDVLWQKMDTLYGAIAAGFDQDCHESHSAAIFLQTGRELIDKFQKGSASILPGEVIVGLGLTGLEERYYRAGVKLAGSKTSFQTKISKDLCQIAVKSEAENTHLALSLSDDGNLFYGETKPPNATHNRNTPIPILSNLTSLNTILRHSPPGSWTIPQKVHLSFLIVSSVMQLCPTRWVNESISSNDILFTPEDTHALTGTGPNRNSISHLNLDLNTNTITPTPFLLRTIPTTSNPRPKSISAPPTNRPGARFALLETAIVLLEIWHQRPFEWYARGSGTPLRNAFWSRLKVAYEWLESSESKSVIVDFVLDVITRLIHCTFDSEQPSPRWEDGVFRGSFFRRVVRVLGEVDGSV
ncbi:uncharacterized protein BDV14DRAFT_199232 [Aspergillus stella-maris]|uniref:uncharacterized protein n=1 Tax=Aspergillus stella-maris TaxID=1810926 RepID=UPI003CCCEA27